MRMIYRDYRLYTHTPQNLDFRVKKFMDDVILVWEGTWNLSPSS